VFQETFAEFASMRRRVQDLGLQVGLNSEDVATLIVEPATHALQAEVARRFDVALGKTSRSADFERLLADLEFSVYLLAE